MIKQLIENQVDIKVRKSKILLSSFNSYFKKVIKVQHPRSASSGSRTAPAAAERSENSEEEKRNRTHIRMKELLGDHHHATHENPMSQEGATLNMHQNESFKSHV
jgi:hypothetical protein